MRVTTGRSSSTAAFASSNVKSRSTGLSSPFVLGIYVWSRALTWLGAIFAFYWFEPNRNPRAGRWDSPLIHDLGSFTDIWARWDSVFFVRIAQHGYDHASAAFYPLYPGLVAVLGRVFFGHYVLAGIVISLAACLGAFALLYRLSVRRAGPARRACPRPRRRLAHRALPCGLPDCALPAGRLQRVALPLPGARRVSRRRARPLHV